MGAAGRSPRSPSTRPGASIGSSSGVGKCEAPAGAQRAADTAPEAGVSSVLVQGIRGSSPAADRLVSLGCLIAFGFDLCRLVQV